MKKLLHDSGGFSLRLKFDLKMKLSVLFLITSLFALQANTSYSQRAKVTLNLENVTLERLIDEIEGQTEFLFVYKTKDVDVNRRVTVKVKKEKIGAVLERVFGNSSTDYNVIDQQIFLTERKVTTPPKQQASVVQDPITVTGKVTEVDGVPLPGVSVVVKGTTRGVATNFDGDYQISVPNTQSVLVFSSIGYMEQEITVGNQTTINVTLQESISQLDEVVLNAGYFSVEKKLSTSSIEKVTSTEIEQQPVTDPIQALQGRVAGVSINQRSGAPGRGFSIQIRGQNSLRNSAFDNGNLPLYIVDGIPFPSTSLSSPDNNAFFPGSTLNTLNPNNIESIEILKDADATAIYGSRGANGVVLITTKKGRSGKSKVTFDISSGLGQITNKMDLLNTEQYIMMRNEAFANDGVQPTARDYDLDFDPNKFTDWQDFLLGGTAEFTDIFSSIEGGNEDFQYLFGLGYQRQTTVYPADFAYQKGSGVFSLNHSSPNKKLNVGLSVNYSYDVNDDPNQDPTRIALRKPPNAPDLIDENGDFTFLDNNLGIRQNPLADFGTTVKTTNSNLIASLNVDYELLPNLRLSSLFSYNNLVFDETEIFSFNSLDPTRFGNPGGFLDEANATVNSWNIEPKLNYGLNLGKVDLNFLVGSTFQNSRTDRIRTRGEGFQDEVFLNNPAAASNFSVSSFIDEITRFTSVYGRVGINWDDKYVLNLTGRRDGSSKFGPGNRFGNFGSVGAAWIFSNEKWLENSKVLSYGKLRASYGTTGNDQIPNFQYLDSYSQVPSADNYLGVSVIEPTRIGNQEFSWETVRKLDVAIELGFLPNRGLNLEANYYQNRSSNQLIGFPIPSITGFSSFQSNFPALVENRGWEFTLSANIFNNANFSWSTNLNLTIPSSELLEFQDIERTAFDLSYEVGESLFIIANALQFNGVDPETGIFDYEDVSGDGTLLDFPNDFLPLADRQEDFFGGLENNFRYKNFEIGFLFQFVKKIGESYIDSFRTPGGYGNQPTVVLDRWREPGDITDVPQFTQAFGDAGLAYALGRSFGENRFEDASFIRLRNLNIGWNVPDRFVKQLKMQELKVYLNAQNLLTFTPYRGLDPESANYVLVPPLRIITTGVRLTF